MHRRTLVLGMAGLVAAAGCTATEESHGHGRGDLSVVVDGDSVDLTADRFQSEHADDSSADFHFHEGESEWFMEGEEPVTFAEAIDLLPHFAYEYDEDHVVTVDDTTYDASDSSTEISFIRNDETVDPREHTLQDDDSLRVTVATDACRCP